MLIELGIAGILALAVSRAMKPKQGVMTPAMRKIFQHALNKTDPPLQPAALLELADILDNLALPAYSELLRKRAALRARPADLKAAHRAAFRRARSSQDPLQVRIAANAFEGMAMTAIAADLRNYAAQLDAAQTVSPLVTPAVDPSAPTAQAVAPQADVAQPDASMAPQDTSALAPSDGSSVTSASANGEGDDDFNEFMTFGGPAHLIDGAVPPSDELTNPSPTPNAVDAAAAAPVSATSTEPADGTEESIAASLGMTEAEYAAWKSGQLQQ